MNDFTGGLLCGLMIGLLMALGAAVVTEIALKDWWQDECVARGYAEYTKDHSFKWKEELK